MMNYKNSSVFWGSRSPLGGLCGISLLVMASGRLAWALSVSAGLLFVYVFSVALFVFLSSPACAKFFPKESRGRVFVCLCYFFAGLYALLLWLLSPLAALEVFFPLFLIPLLCADSGVFWRGLSLGENAPPKMADLLKGPFAKSAGEAAAESGVLALLLVLVSLVREPLAYFSLSFPSPSSGMVTLFSFYYGALLPARLFAGSAGSLLLLGYLTGAYQQLRKKLFPAGGIE